VDENGERTPIVIVPPTTRINIAKTPGTSLSLRVNDNGRSFSCKRAVQNESLYVEHESSPQSLGYTIEEKNITNKKATAELCIHYRIMFQGCKS